MQLIVTIKSAFPKKKLSLRRKFLITGLAVLTVLVFSFATYIFILASPSNSEPDLPMEVKGITNPHIVENSTEAYDVEVVESYREELSEYLNQLVFFLYLNDSAYRLADEDMAREKEYIELIHLNGELCPYEKYEDLRDDMPEGIEKKLNNIETLNRNFCDELLESSELMLQYFDTNDVEEMKDLIIDIREINEDNYNNRLLIEKILEEILSVIE